MRRPMLLVSLLAICIVIAFFALAYPVYVIRPFRAQEAGELALALAVRSWAPTIAATAALVALITAVTLRPFLRRRLARVFTIAGAVSTVLFAALTYVNIFERMFHRIESPESVSAGEASLDGDDMVIAIRVAGHARAYPIRMMGYHHIVNDWVGGVPVVGTY
jgi:hypothetical protein